MWRALGGRLNPGLVRLLAVNPRTLGRSRHLHGLLSAIENESRRRRSLEHMLAVLDKSRPELFACLRDQFASPVEAKALTLKILNLCLAKYHFSARSTALPSRPFGLVVDPSNSCNLACPGCVHSEHAKALKLFDWKPGILAENRIDRFLSCYGPRAIHVTFCNYGEPLVNPHTQRFIRRAKSYLMMTLLSTNLSLGALRGRSLRRVWPGLHGALHRRSHSACV